MVLTYRLTDGTAFKFEPPDNLAEWDSLAKTLDPITLALVTFTPTESVAGRPLLRISNWSRNKLRAAAKEVGKEVFMDLSREVAKAFFLPHSPRNPLGLLIYRCHEVANSQSLAQEN